MSEPPDPAGGGPVELLPLALSRPNEASARAKAVLDRDPPPLDAAVAHQVIGIVLREFGDIEAAVAELQHARRLAKRARAPGREADVAATLGVTLVYAGRTTAGRRILGHSVTQSSGHLRARILYRRGLLEFTLGRHRQALADLDAAVPVLQAAGDRVWEARALTQRAFANLALGAVRPAVHDLEAAAVLFAETGQELEIADSLGNRAVLAADLGDLPTALALFDRAAESFEALGVPDLDFTVERCAALLAAGLARDALTEAEAALAKAERLRLRPTRRAELLLTAADCALASGQPEAALARAAEAERLFRDQGRHWWSTRARLTRLRAALDRSALTVHQLRDAERCVWDLAAAGSPDVLLGRLTAGRIALALGRPETARAQLLAAAACRRQGPVLSRAQGWLAEAELADAAGDTRRVMHACRRGLAVIDEHRSMLGSWELRAQATAHGAELARLGVRHAAALGRPRQLLLWSERWRAVAHAVPSVRPPDDEELTGDLAAMRAVTRQIRDGAPRSGPARQQVQRERQRLERAIRARDLHRRGTGTAAEAAIRGVLDVGALLAALGDDRLLQLVEIDGRLQVLVCGGGAVRRYQAGILESAVREVVFARFALTRLVRRPRAATSEAVERLHELGVGLEHLLLGDAVVDLGGGRLVVVPPGRLHAIPWALLPSLAGRTFSVAPSATSWLRARRPADALDAALDDAADGLGPGSGARVVLVRGPGLASEGEEVPLLAAEYGPANAPIVLGAGTATVARVLQAVDGADLVHIASHGTFRVDSPLFSALHLDDGPLTLYDLAGLRRGPRRLVLPCCDSGVVAPVGADEIVGLASSLLPLGTTAIVASVVPVDDSAVVPLMLRLHRRMRAGAGMAESLRDVRVDAVDGMAFATAHSFIALGADAT